VVFWSGGALDMFVTRNYLPRSSLMLAGALIALLVGTLVFRIFTDVHTRYAAMRERLQRIASLNHEIRNGLQVIAYHNASKPGGPVSAEVNAAVAQIEAALREISCSLPERK
jgi:type II secretory pathway component PulM